MVIIFFIISDNFVKRTLFSINLENYNIFKKFY